MRVALTRLVYVCMCSPSGGLLLQFAIAWWVMIDATAYANYTKDSKITGVQYIPGIVSSLGLVLMNLVTQSQLNQTESALFSGGGASRARVWFLVSMIICFGGLIGSVWIMVDRQSSKSAKSQWPGAAIMLQNFLIFASGLVFFFGRGDTGTSSGF